MALRQLNGLARQRGAHTGQTIVIKLGTSSLLRPEQNTLNLSSLARLCETVRMLCAEGHRVVVVSSGAVGVGMQRLGLEVRPKDLAQRQALAAIGQVHLMRFYEDLFNALGLPCAQVLLTLENLSNRGQYLNARNTFSELFKLGSVPVVNENDTVAVEELRFGDNDTLSAQVATLVRADWLFLLTDVPSLFTANPALDPHAQPIHEVHDLANLQVDTASSRGMQWGTGGMVTKLTAARIATASGCRMVISSAADPESIPRVMKGARVGTVFHPSKEPLTGRKRWILAVPVKGEVWLDAGAVRAVAEKHQSLFSAGIVRVAGDFQSQDAVRLCGPGGQEFGRALCNYSAADLEKIKGKPSRDFLAALGFHGPEEIAARYNVCLLGESGAGSEDEAMPRSPATAAAAGRRRGPSGFGAGPVVGKPPLVVLPDSVRGSLDTSPGATLAAYRGGPTAQPSELSRQASPGSPADGGGRRTSSESAPSVSDRGQGSASPTAVAAEPRGSMARMQKTGKEALEDRLAVLQRRGFKPLEELQPPDEFSLRYAQERQMTEQQEGDEESGFQWPSPGNLLRMQAAEGL